MKFELGDETDRALCVALKHEFLRCDEAFNQFATAATILIRKGDNRRLAYNAYNAYRSGRAWSAGLFAASRFSA